MGNGSKSLKRKFSDGETHLLKARPHVTLCTVDSGEVSRGFEEVDFTLDRSLLTQGQSELL